ncbi:Transposase [Mariniphaga anaerophila]|uniref:Transposase n=1 Tax=Mariniphaga anaerophila TaxID=1484053 RepID=A0A1M4UBL5_9BACT|nr:ISL3 family transposase [Mariniphaga anaerophila]SHE54182.1 Transposase [Mariniphaga anaerophila]
MNIKRRIDIPKIIVSNIEFKPPIIHIYASLSGKRAKCPECKKYSHSVHDRYERRITDLPVFQYHSRIILTIRKFKCRNDRCKRKVFTEQNDNILPYARRTERVTRLLSDIAIDMPTGSGHVLSEKLQIKVSRSTLTRLAHQQPLPDINTLKVVGVDDWAFRKGVNYGTILVDMETSKPIDMLPTRDSEDLKAWLRDHPGIEIITRDRASSYSTAIDSISPNTVQVADRFHLLMNLSDALDTFFKSISPKISKLIKAKTCEMLRDAEAESKQDSVTKKEFVEIPAPVQKPDSRQEVFDMVKKLQAKGLPRKKIGRELGISKNTVKRYFQQDILVPRSHPKRANIEIFTNYILSKMEINGYTNMEIINDIRKMGYTGGNTQANQYISFLKQTNEVTSLNYNELQSQPIPYIKRLSSRKLAKYVGQSLNHIENIDHRSYMQLLFENMPILIRVRRLVKRFKKMLKTGEGQIHEWIKSIQESKDKLPGLKTFAKGLKRDIKAVQNAIQLRWSNGPVEGHVNRIKSIKRQMYGRASFELLRRKVLLSQSG